MEKDDRQNSNKRVETAEAEENSEKTDEPVKKKANPNNPLLTRTGTKSCFTVESVEH